ncbi:DUF1294 domain-containing protein [Paenibacillus hamazuiensis]|uniref:DUF1294 domain-containing protein n=1 Tax=Paenibacillus hamazuiensis TaxID=2936508 RepID=UPI00200F1D04|nr:DUF1294 domain-containing protein [Paenibacillus hamazuiensis]
MRLFLLYLLAINIVCFLEMRYDKRQAVHNRRRVPEKRLFLLAALGGAAGGWLGMRVWRHKTKHPTFYVGFPALLIVNAACVYAAVTYFIQ